jgi:hypothetical protein
MIIINASGLYRFKTNVTSQITFLLQFIFQLRNYYPNKRLQENINYEFSNRKMNVIGESFSSEIDWSKLLR